MRGKVFGLLAGALVLGGVAMAADCPYTVIPYTFSVAMWGNPGAPAAERNLIPQEPIFGTDSAGNITTAASLEECNAVRAEFKAVVGFGRVIGTCHPTTPVVLEGDIH